jgi:hypothetical protein
MSQVLGRRKQPVIDLMRKLAKLCCSSVLSPPLPFVEALRIGPLDTEEEKAQKIAEHEQKVADRERERIRREPELMFEMDSIMRRVVAARSETTFDAVDPNLAKVKAMSSSSVPSLYCDMCHNKVSYIVYIRFLLLVRM